MTPDPDIPDDPPRSADEFQIIKNKSNYKVSGDVAPQGTEKNDFQGRIDLKVERDVFTHS